MLFSEIILDNEKFRIDDEFFMKEYISAYRKIKSIPNIVLKDEISVLTDFHANGSYEAISEVFELLDEPNFAYMVRTTDLETNNFSDNVKYITKKAYNFLSKSQVFGGELLINKIGTPGKSYLMPYLNRPTSLGMNLFLIRTNENSCINEKFLYIYFNTNFGLKIINRKINGTVPLTIDKAAIRSLYVPKFESDLIYEISSLVDKVFDLELEAKSMYRQAELLLLDTLKLKDFNPPSQTINIKSFSNSFCTSGRLDAEFYQEKYEGYLKKIQAYPYGCEPIRTACKLKDANYTPKDNQTYQYIELSNIGNLGEITGASLDLGCNLPSRARRKVSKNDVIVSSVEGSLASCAIVSEQYHQALCSTGFYVVSSEKINSETLLILFKSEPIQQLLKQGCSGTILTAINKDEFLNIPLPLVDANIQTQIADLIRQSDHLRQESQALLEEAKRKVEQAIEG